MANRPADRLQLRRHDRRKLEHWVRASSVPAAQARRARIVLLAADGMANYRIAEMVGVTRPTVNQWRRRYAERGIAGLMDEDRPGRPATVDQFKIITETLNRHRRSSG